MLAENYIPGCPAVPQADVDAAFVGMKDYIFFKKNEIVKEMKDYSCTACGEKYSICIPSRTYTNDELELYRTKHREYCKCARCGKNLEVINRNIKKKAPDTTVKAVAIIVPTSENEVWIRCELFYKSYANFPPNLYGESYEAYRFVKGEEVEYYRCRYWYNCFERYNTVRPIPFSGCGFTIAGLDRLDETFFKYSSFRQGYCITDVHYDFSYLALYARYPRLTEMLMKKGFYDLVDFKKNKRDLRKICNWNAKDPKKFFKLSPNEIKLWQEHKYDVKTAKTYITMFRGVKDGFDYAAQWNYQIGNSYSSDVEKISKKYNASYVDILKYIKKQKERFYFYRDYIDAAEKCKLDLKVHNVLFPKNLRKAHDDAITTVQAITSRQEYEKAKKRLAELVKLYSFNNDLYLIRPPYDTSEIVAEGKALQHCVGGYAGRHANGTTTILFMRSASEPDKPLYTIEMHGKNLRQVHGYKNTTSPNDNPEAKAFFDEWLEWVKAGSPKKKQNKKKADSVKSVTAEMGVAV